ncbi:hypothetical protein DL765_008852 [Monosporascus sp. GIB2]|nr:hypothetical protein DL765_008852 [Monosporascus sp. GIB2]
MAEADPVPLRGPPGSESDNGMADYYRIWVALGGWAFNDPGPTQTTFSDIASSSANTDIFLDSLVQMMNRYGFDGVDIDWEYPVAEDRNGRPGDYENAVTFMKKIRSRMNDSKRGVSMAIPASYWYLQNFDIKALEAQVDWFNVMTYDVHGSWDIDNKWTGPPTKVTMGMAFYSRSFTLRDPGCSSLGCRVSSGGNAGKYSNTVGVLLHPEIQEIVAENKLTPVLNREGAVKTVSWGNQWVSFDDAATWRLKANVARSQCIEGFMVWAMSQDDNKGTNIRGLNQGLGRKTPDFPDFTPIDKPPKAQPAMAPKLCRWSSCFEGCPSRFKEVQRDGHKEIMMDTSDSVKLALSIGFHVVPGRETGCYGYNAFCCSDPKYVEPRDDDFQDPFGSVQAKEFKLLISKYMENPTCPATILEPPIHDQYGGSSNRKRDLLVGAQQYDILQGRATDCALANWEKMLTYAALMFSMLDTGFDAVRRIWDNDFAGHYDEELQFANIQDFMYDYPWLDTRAHLEYVLLNPLSAGLGMRNTRRAGELLCWLAPHGSKRGLTERIQGAERVKRVVWPTSSDQSDVPNFETILDGILNGDLGLHYARWQWAWGAESNAPAGPFLELAYWIGPDPGVATTGNTRYDPVPGHEAQKPSTRGLRSVVFHMHIDQSDPTWLIREGGHTYMGIPGFRIFYGQEARPFNNNDGAWRAEGGGRSQLTARHGWDCPEDEGYWRSTPRLQATWSGLQGVTPRRLGA